MLKCEEDEKYNHAVHLSKLCATRWTLRAEAFIKVFPKYI